MSAYMFNERSKSLTAPSSSEVRILPLSSEDVNNVAVEVILVSSVLVALSTTVVVTVTTVELDVVVAFAVPFRNPQAVGLKAGLDVGAGGKLHEQNVEATEARPCDRLLSRLQCYLSAVERYHITTEPTF